MEASTDSIDETTPQGGSTGSPKPMAFTIDFGGGKTVDNKRHKLLVEKYQNRHRRGQSLSKLDDTPTATPPKPHPHSANLPRKSSFQSEGYFSSDEKIDKRNVRSAGRNRIDLTLPLKSVGNQMTQSFPNGSFNLTTIKSPELELKDVSSPEMELVSPYSPKDSKDRKAIPSQFVQAQAAQNVRKTKILRQYSSPECEEKFVDGGAFDFDKSDTVSDAGTYTLDTDNYTEEQKVRMSIDREFNIEQISVMKKAEEYVQSLSKPPKPIPRPRTLKSQNRNTEKLQNLQLIDTPPLPTPRSPNIPQSSILNQNGFTQNPTRTNILPHFPDQKLSPILSPTQNISIIQPAEDESNSNSDKILFPSPKSKTGIGNDLDQGCFTSVTSSGAFRKKVENNPGHTRQPSLTKSEIQVLTYTDDSLTKKEELSIESLPPPIGGLSGKNSPTKIPSPIHSARPRSRNSNSSLNIDFSDSSLETESYLKNTQNYIYSLQKRLSAESDQDSDYDSCRLRLNNETHDLLKQKPVHVRHNSFDDKNLQLPNKLEHFQSKNLQGIDQTYNKLNQYGLQHKVVQKIQNSPNNSPIKRSSSFSTKNQNAIGAVKVTNLNAKESNLKQSPNLARSNVIQRSASTANIKPNSTQLRRSSINSDFSKIDRSQFGDTESSSEDDFDKNMAKKKDFSNLTVTRYNRAFSLRRGRLDTEQPTPKCPNTPEMRRKFQPSDHLRGERATSMDRRPVKTNEVQSRYLHGVTKSRNTPDPPKNTKTTPVAPKSSSKPQTFSRTDSGRFSMRASSKPPVTAQQKGIRKDGGKSKSGPRSSSSLTSKEVEFQNWKRRKSYDPMKAAAEGKKKAELAKKINQAHHHSEAHHQNQDCDSSPSHSSSVHRSQSFHGTAALEQLISSEEEDDLTLSADEGFSPPTPSPCNLSPARAKLRNAWKDRLLL